MIQQIAHACFLTNNLAAMVKFYRDGLGLGVHGTFDNPAGEPVCYYFDAGNRTFLEISDYAKQKAWGHPDIGELAKGNCYRHLCFQVTDLSNFVETLRRRGVEVTDPKLGCDQSFQAWAKDPDGHEIELMEYTEKSFQVVARSNGAQKKARSS